MKVKFFFIPCECGECTFPFPYGHVEEREISSSRKLRAQLDNFGSFMHPSTGAWKKLLSGAKASVGWQGSGEVVLSRID